MQQFTDAISKCDMSAVNVFFVASVPGSHKEKSSKLNDFVRNLKKYIKMLL